jgi:NADH-quinone oxidoreductase subunit C
MSSTVASATDALQILEKTLGAGRFQVSEFRDNVRVHVEKDDLLNALQALKEQGGYDHLTELGATDYLGYPGRNAGHRFEVHYVLRNLVENRWIILKVGVSDPDPTLPTAYNFWMGADWMEREIYDMYGIRFEGHPDLRRILMPEEFVAFPLRKDYPLRGRGERHNFQKINRGDS